MSVFYGSTTVCRIYDRNLLRKSEESLKFQMTVNDLLDSEFCIGKAFVFFLVHAVKLHIEKHCFLTVFDCENVTGYASALTTA